MAKIERRHVFDFYNKVADHFSQTRHKTWPAISGFVHSLSPKSKVLDSGCGNGKNILIRDDLEWTGIDTSIELLKICRGRDISNLVLSDTRVLPFKDNSFDYTISVAVLHHIFAPEDRLKACSEMVRVTKPGGRIFIQVWQNTGVSDTKFIPIDNSNGDYFVTWKNKERVLKRYYHLFNESEIDGLINKLDGIVLEDKFVEAKNWVFILKKLR